LGQLPGARIRAFREEGSSLNEFAMVLPLLGMVLTGIIWGGITFYDYVTLADAVAVGARTLATSRGTTDPCTLANTALTNAATNLRTAQITIAAESFQGSGGSSCTALQPGDAGTVSATYPCNMTIPFAGINLCPIKGGSGTSCPDSAYCIQASATARIE